MMRNGKQVLSVARRVLVAFLLIASGSTATANHKGKPHGNPGGDPPPPPTPQLEYSIEFVGLSGSDDTYLYDLNNLGDIVGGSYDAGGVWHSFLYNSATGLMDLTSQVDPNSDLQLGSLRGINDNGVMVGRAWRNGISEPIRMTLPGGGSYAVIDDLGTLGGSGGIAWSINNSGQIAGESHIATGELRGFYHSPGDGMVDIGHFGGGHSAAKAINASGQVTGYARSPGFWQHTFRYTPEHVDDGQVVPAELEHLGTLWKRYNEGQRTFGDDINDGGAVVGTGFSQERVQGNHPDHAFLALPGQPMIDLGTIGDGFNSKALGINNNGEVVGASEIGQAGDYHAFLWTDEFGMQRLEDFVIDLPASFDGRLEEAVGINDAGQIIGHAALATGSRQAFLLTPVVTGAAIAVPEPSSLLLVSTALAGVLLVRRRRITPHECPLTDPLTSFFCKEIFDDDLSNVSIHLGNSVRDDRLRLGAVFGRRRRLRLTRWRLQGP